MVQFRRNWLQRLDLDPAQSAVLRVQNEPTEPTIATGSSILVKRSRTRRRDGLIFVVWAKAGLAVRGEGGGWKLVSDHPACAPVAFPEDAVIPGRAVWMARALVYGLGNGVSTVHPSQLPLHELDALCIQLAPHLEVPQKSGRWAMYRLIIPIVDLANSRFKLTACFEFSQTSAHGTSQFVDIALLDGRTPKTDLLPASWTTHC